MEDRSWLSNKRIDGIEEKLDEKGQTYDECQEQVHELPSTWDPGPYMWDPI